MKTLTITTIAALLLLSISGSAQNTSKAEHWHGASPDAGMLQQYILPKTEKGIVTWLHKVTDEEYLGSK